MVISVDCSICWQIEAEALDSSLALNSALKLSSLYWVGQYFCPESLYSGYHGESGNSAQYPVTKLLTLQEQTFVLVFRFR